MKKGEKQELDQLFLSIIHLFDGICWICQQPYSTKKAFTIHHRVYKCFECDMTFSDIKKMLKHRTIHPNTDKVYTDFKNGKKVDKIAYYRYLMPLVIKEPERFLLLHHIHHWMVENLARPKPVFFSRLVHVAKEINERRYGTVNSDSLCSIDYVGKTIYRLDYTVEGMNTTIKLFELAKEIKKGDLLIADKFSIEGRVGTELKIVPQMQGETRNEINSSIQHCLKRYEISEQLLRQFYWLILEEIEKQKELQSRLDEAVRNDKSHVGMLSQ